MLPFAFDNLRLQEVWAEVLATNARSRRVLAKCGFRETGERVHGEPQWPAGVPLVRHAIGASAWRAWRDAPALAALHPTLQSILALELAAGNEVAETGQGWPDPDSVFVRLRRPFAALPQPLPDGVQYHQLDDPHWWKAEVATLRPRADASPTSEREERVPSLPVGADPRGAGAVNYRRPGAGKHCRSAASTTRPPKRAAAIRCRSWPTHSG